MDATAGNRDSSPPHVDALVLAGAGGRHLAGDVATPPVAVAAAVLCHPHPDYGGDRFNAVIEALFRALPAAGMAALRFDFRRPVEGPGIGSAAADVTAALEEAAGRFTGLPRFVVGYSFGAAAALAATTTPPAALAGAHAVAGLVLIAPPLALLPAAAQPPVPVLVVVAASDQYSPPADVAPVVAGWSDAELEVIEMADHFLAGRTTEVAGRVVAWLTRQTDR